MPRCCRQFTFTAIILLIEIPLGVAVALAMPRSGPWVSVCLVLMALPLLIPWNVVGAMWNIFALPDIGLLGYGINALGIDYNFTRQPGSAWFTVVLMDVWHWTSLVVLLAYAGLRSIPDAYYQAAKIDGASRWAVFRYIQLPKMNRVLTIAVLLRFMDSFMVYTEPFVLTGGGPGNATTFLSIDLVKAALGEFNLGIAAAMSIIYFLMTLLVCWIFYTLMTKRTRRPEMAAAKDGTAESSEALMRDKADAAAPATSAAHSAPAVQQRREGRFLWLVPTLYIIFLMLPIYWLLNMSFKTTNEILGGFSLWPRNFTVASYVEILTNPVWYNGYISSITYVIINTVISVSRGAAGGLRLLALPIPRRQASVLLAADQPHGAAGGVRAAVLPALFGDRPVRHALGGGARALPVQHPAGRLDPRRLHVRRAEGDRRDRLYRRLFLAALLREDLHAADRVAASASPPSSASCSRGSSCCWPRR